MPPTHHNSFYVKSVGQDQQTYGQLHPPGCQEAELSTFSAPLPLLPYAQRSLDWGGAVLLRCICIIAGSLVTVPLDWATELVVSLYNKGD